MKFLLEAQLLVPMSTAQARPNDGRGRYARLWWGSKSPSSHEASLALTARTARLIAMRLLKSRTQWLLSVALAIAVVIFCIYLAVL
jgi:hypothetical protein